MICPICKSELQKVDNTYQCQNKHSFDISKDGYVNLLISKVNSGDNKESTSSRLLFLQKHYYDTLGINIKNIISSLSNDFKVLDLGCGVGYYDQFIPSKSLIGIDISKYAIIKASKLNKNNLYIVGTNAKLPFNDNEFDLIVAIFAPLYINETKRVLNNNGYIITVTPGTDHLIELKSVLYNDPYLNPNKIIDIDGFIVKTTNLKYKQNVIKDDIINLIKMTPYNYKTSKDALESIDNTSLDITFDFNINLYSPKF